MGFSGEIMNPKWCFLIMDPKSLVIYLYVVFMCFQLH